MGKSEGRPKAVSRAEYARLAGLSRARVTQLGNDDLLALTSDGLVDVAATDKLRSAVLDPLRGGDRTGKQAAPVNATAAAGSLLAARLRELHVRVARVERRGRELAAAAVWSSDAVAEGRVVVEQAVARLRQWPAEVAVDLAGVVERGQVHQLVTSSIEAICNAIADEAVALSGALPPDGLAADIEQAKEVSAEAYKAAQAREADARAQVGALEEYLETGLLAAGDLVADQARDRGVTAREALLAVPDRTAGQVAAATDPAVIERLLSGEIELICQELMREGKGTNA